jgi:predicted transcriptional regulator
MDTHFVDDPYFYQAQKRYMLEEDLDHSAKKARIEQYPGMPTLSPDSLGTFTTTPTLGSYNHSMSPQSMLPTPQYTYSNYNTYPNGMSSNGPPGSSFLPFQHSQQRDNVYDYARNSALMQQPQVYYFSSPPYMPSTPRNYSQITTLQGGGLQTHVGSPLTQLLHSPLTERDHEFDHALSQVGYKFGGTNTSLNALASVASVNNHNKPIALFDDVPQEKSRKKAPKDTLKKKEGLEESSLRIISLLQTKGKMIFKDIHETLSIDYRRAYDILNILQTTGLITKTGKKRENKMPYVYQDGAPLSEPVDLRDLLFEIKKEEELNKKLSVRISTMEIQLAKDETASKIAGELQQADSTVREDPSYKELLKELST